MIRDKVIRALEIGINEAEHKLRQHQYEGAKDFIRGRRSAFKSILKLIEEGVTHDDVIYNYFNSYERQPCNHGFNVYYEGDTLYSYGPYYILAQKINNGYLLNGDGYGVSTAKHQRITLRHAPSNNVIIPFSALFNIFSKSRAFCNAGNYYVKLNAQDIIILDKEEDSYETTYYKNKDGESVPYEVHHLGASLIQYKRRYFLSGLDASGKDSNTYYLIELIKPCKTVKDAFRSLAGNLSDLDYMRYLAGEIKRQGEYFLIPVTETNATRYLKNKGVKTPRKIMKHYDIAQGIGNAHIATECIKINNTMYIRKTLRHREHKMQRLGDIWHKVVINTQKNSWTASTASGNVD